MEKGSWNLGCHHSIWGNHMTTPHTDHQQAASKAGISLTVEGTFSSFSYPISMPYMGTKGTAGSSNPVGNCSSVVTGCCSLLKLCVGFTNSFKAHLTAEEVFILNLSEFLIASKSTADKTQHIQDSQTVEKLPDVQARMCSPQGTNLPGPQDVPSRAPATKPAHLEMSNNHSVCSSGMSSGVTGAFPAPWPDSLLLSHHLWAKVTQLTQLPLSPSPVGTRCPKPSPPASWEPPGPRDVPMLPWVGKGKGHKVSPVPATPGDKARGALPSRERWESSTFPRGRGWIPRQRQESEDKE